MRIRPIDLTIHLDPIHKSEEIWDYLLNSEFKNRIEPLNIWKPNQTPPTLDDEDYHENIRGSTLKKDASIKLEEHELLKPSNRICAIFKAKKKKEEGFFKTAHFLCPRVGSENNQLILEWLEPDFFPKLN